MAAILAENECCLGSVCSDLASVQEALTQAQFGAVLVDLAEDANPVLLSEIKNAAGDTPIVIWADDVSKESVAHAIQLGVRGVLRKTLPPDIQVRCLEKVAAGELWIEKSADRRPVLEPIGMS